MIGWATVARLLPKWGKYVAVAAAAASLLTLAYCKGHGAAEADCQAAELARQLAQEQELTRIAQEAAQAAEGRRLYAERQAEALQASRERVAAVDWACGAEDLPRAVYDEVR